MPIVRPIRSSPTRSTSKIDIAITHSANLVKPTEVSRTSAISLARVPADSTTDEVREQEIEAVGPQTLVVHYDVLTFDHPESIVTSATTFSAAPTVATTEDAPPQILSGPLSRATAGRAYAFDAVTSRFGPQNYGASGLERTGLVISPTTGHLSGVPTIGGVFPVTVTAHSSAGGPDTTASYSLVITATAPAITTTTAPGTAAMGQVYSYQVTASGNPAPQFAIAAGQLPGGVKLNKVTGVISGTPTTAGTYTFRVVAASLGGSDSRDYEITVSDTSGDM